ncbi:hypothetical protein FBU59_004717 [Linderina macrospora]|uniref:Uncharacterized protein n=1 Tax=Linderina macrospora TaxID=4868 RepID=A0ACC1J517_9FUNG|nr:hypothetical protein FBU59_004717 [Linderina macrospora]
MPVISDAEYQQTTLGSLVSSAHAIKVDEKVGCYFCFPDIRVRYAGRFTLRFSLISIPTTGSDNAETTEVLTHVFSNPFTVYTMRDFPGVDGRELLAKRAKATTLSGMKAQATDAYTILFLLSLGTGSSLDIWVCLCRLLTQHAG